MARREDHTPQRTCIATRSTRPREELLRFVRAPDGEVVFDLKGNLPGRGAWLAPTPEAFEQALRNRAFARAFRAQVKVPDDLLQRTRAQICKAALDTLSLARKAGEAVAGFEKVRAWLKGGEAALVIAARDGGVHGRRKIAALIKGLELDIEVLQPFDAAQLGLAFGRERVIHAAMKDGGLARRFAHLARLCEALAGERPDGQRAGRPARAMEMEQNGQ